MAHNLGVLVAHYKRRERKLHTIRRGQIVLATPVRPRLIGVEVMDALNLDHQDAGIGQIYFEVEVPPPPRGVHTHSLTARFRQSGSAYESKHLHLGQGVRTAGDVHESTPHHGHVTHPPCPRELGN